MSAPAQTARLGIIEPRARAGVAEDAVRACAIDASGRRALVAGRQLRQFDLQTGSVTVTGTFPSHGAIIGHSRRQRNGQTLFWSTQELLLPAQDESIRTESGGTGFRHFDAAAVLGRYQRLAVATRDAEGQSWVQVFAALSMLSSVRLSQRRPDRSLWMDTFGDDGLVNGRADGTVELWLVADFSPAASIELSGHSGPVVHGVVGPNDRLLVTAGADLTVRMWSIGSSPLFYGTPSAVCEGHTDHITDLTVTPDGRYAVTASRDRTIRLWGLHDGRIAAVLADHSDWVTHLALNPAGTHLASCSDDGAIKVWDLASQQCVGTAYVDSRVLCLAMAADAVCAGDAAGNFWVLEVSALTAAPLQ